MKLIEPSLGFVFTVASCVAAIGCTVESTPPYVYCPTAQACSSSSGGAVGDVVLTWSIDGDATGALCAPHNAAQIEVRIADASGQAVDDWRMPCTVGASDETLPAGTYTATAQLEDATGSPITTADPAQIAIYPGASSTPLEFDFEENSFTNGT